MIRSRAAYYAVFTVSGLAGLVYESIWTRYLQLFLGHAANAQTLVLCIFMGGMALGAWLVARLSPRSRRLLWIYAAVEAVIGLVALLFHPLYVFIVEYTHGSLLPNAGTPETARMLTWIIGALMIIPQSVLLGTTFPLMTSGVLRRFPSKPGRTIAMLYFCNSAGAVVGVLVSGFVLIETLGLPGTIATAGVLNLLVATVVFSLARGVDGPPPVARPESGATGGLLLAVAALTGTASFIYEIGWIRMLSLVLGGTTHSFELMLSAFIGGLAIGGLWIRRRIDRFDDPIRILGMVQVLMGCLAVLTLPLYANSFLWMQKLVAALPLTDGGYRLFLLSSHGIAMAVMLPATVCAGMTLPLITHSLMRRGAGERAIGTVYGVNTAGAIAGVVLAVHVGLPFLGLKGMIIAGAAIDVGLGAILLYRRAPAAWAVAGALVLAVAAITVPIRPSFMASGVYMGGGILDEDTRFLFHEDGKTATITVTELNHIKSIRTNGKSDAAIAEGPDPGADYPTMVLAAALVPAYRPDARLVANIGLGSGLTTHALLALPSLEQVDTIEIEAKMEEGAKQFGADVERVWTDPRSQVHIEDAKTYFSVMGKTYDAIATEPSNPWISGVADLFSREFYHMVKQHLRPDGVLVQWVGVYNLEFNLLATVVEALSLEFDDWVLYSSNRGDFIFAARPRGKLPRPSWEGLEAMGVELDRASIRSEHDLELRRIGDRDSLLPLFEASRMPANSHFYPVLESGAGRSRFLHLNSHELTSAGMTALPYTDLLTGRQPGWQQSQATKSTDIPRIGNTLVAEALLGFLRDGVRQELIAGRPVPDSIWENAEIVSAALENCGSIAKGEWFTGVYNSVIKRMLPYLAPGEMAFIWERLESEACRADLDAVQMALVGLIKGIALRDGAITAANGETILRLVQQMHPDLAEAVIPATVAAYIQTGDFARGLALWTIHADKLTPGFRSSMPARLLEAHMAAGNKPPN